MVIRDELLAICTGIAGSRVEPFTGNPLAHRISHEWRDATAAAISDPSFKIQGSSGRGQWAETVWLAVFDRMVTETAEEGFYVVYLVERNGNRIFLSLNQGTKEIHKRVGGRRYLKALANTAARDLGLLSQEDTRDLIDGPIELSGKGTLTRGYEAGNILAIEYQPDAIPSEQALSDDLIRMLLLYQSLVVGRDQVERQDSDGGSNGAPGTGLEAERFGWHKRAERSRWLAREAKRIHGSVCQVAACGKDLAEIYGDIGDGYIEAHHLTPFAELNGRPTELDPKADFAVVCPDCHRMIHRRAGEPYSLDEVNSMIMEVV